MCVCVCLCLGSCMDVCVLVRVWDKYTGWVVEVINFAQCVSDRIKNENKTYLKKVFFKIQSMWTMMGWFTATLLLSKGFSIVLHVFLASPLHNISYWKICRKPICFDWTPTWTHHFSFLIMLSNVVRRNVIKLNISYSSFPIQSRDLFKTHYLYIIYQRIVLLTIKYVFSLSSHSL